MEIKSILVSRTDSIGDVVLTLPITAWLKLHFPKAKITFLCKNYTKPIVQNFKSVDAILCNSDLFKDEKKAITLLSEFDVIIHVFPDKKIARLAKKARIKWRIGTSHRLFHWLTCNKKVSFTRKNSELHESQLNYYLLKPLGLKQIPSYSQIGETMDYYEPKAYQLPDMLSTLDYSKAIILHPKSQGSAQEWPVFKFNELAMQLVTAGFIVLFTGTENEGKLFRDEINWQERIVDVTGKLDLFQLQTLIHKSFALVACSTGPYHVAGIAGIKAIGLFAPIRPIHPGRWKALGKKAVSLTYDSAFKVGSQPQSSDMVSKISVFDVLKAIEDGN